MPGRRGQRGRVTRRTCRRSPYALPLPGWGTTESATGSHRRGSGNELRFSWVGVVWYERILRGQGASSAPQCASASDGTSGRGQGDRGATIDSQQCGIHCIQAGFHNRGGEMLGEVNCQLQELTFPADQGGADLRGGEGCHRVSLN